MAVLEPPTAPSAVLPTKRPSTIESTVEYSCCKSVPSMIGRKNCSIPFQMEPCVRSDAACVLARDIEKTSLINQNETVYASL